MSRKPKHNTIALTDEQVNKILTSIFETPKRRLSKKELFSRLRNYIMVRLSYFNGLRPKEVYNARIECINLRNGLFYIPAENNKQRHEDLWELPASEIQELKNYLKIRKKLFPKSSWFFPTRTGSRMSRFTPTRIIKILSKKAGLNFRINFYTLRHSFATKCQIKFKDIKITANLLRHRDFQCRSALRYIHTAESTKRFTRLNELWE